MIVWAIMDAEGVYPVNVGQSTEVPPGAIAVQGLSPQQIARSYRVDGAWVARPLSPAATVEGGIVTVSGCPAGAFADVADVELVEHLARVPAVGGAIVISLPDPGVYRIEVDFGRPFLPRQSEVVIP